MSDTRSAGMAPSATASRKGPLEPHRVVQLLAGLPIEPAAAAATPVVPPQSDMTKPGYAQSPLSTLVQQPPVLAGMGAVDAVVGAHDRARLPTLDGDLESEQIALPQRRLVIVASTTWRPVSWSLRAKCLAVQMTPWL